MPPSEPTNSLAPPSQKPDEPLAQFAKAFRSQDTVEEVWAVIKETYESAYSEEKRAGAYFSRLKDQLGNDVMMGDKVRNVYDINTPREDRVFYVHQIAIDRDCSIPVGSALRPEGFQKRKFSDLTPTQQKALKRRRLQQSRYGALVDELSADKPVTSRETTEEGAQDGHVDQDQDGDEEARVDNDGFKIPQKITKPQRRRTEQTGGEPTAVLVADSQPEDPAHPPYSAATALRERVDRSNTRHQTTPPDHSSPAEQAASRANTAAPQSRAAQTSNPQNATATTNSRSARTSSSTRQTFPTPDSRERQRSGETPPSAQQPPSSELPVSAGARRFRRKTGTLPQNPENNMAEEDPIEDDETLLQAVDDGIADYEDGEDDADLPAQPGGRTRSRSLESIPQNRDTSDAVNQSESQPPHSGTAFEELSSSRAASRSSRSKSTKKWSVEEDAILLRAQKLGMTGPQIQSHFNIDRTESSIRNRKRTLLNLYPSGNMPRKSELFQLLNASEEESYVAPASQPQPWTPEHVSKLRKAMSEGFDMDEIRAKHFVSRSSEAVIKKMREFQQSVIRFAKEEDDFPKDDLSVPEWTDQHNLKLRRAVKENTNEVDARQRWFSTFSKADVHKKLAAYKAQREQGTTPNTNASAPNEQADMESELQQPSEMSEPQDTQPAEHQDLEDANNMAVSQPDSQAQLDSSPPEVYTPPRPRISPVVEVIAEAETNTQGSQLRRSNGNGGQTLLNFQKDKGKGVDRPARPSTRELDQQFGRTSSRPTSVQAPTSAQQDGSNAEEPIETQSGNDADANDDEDGDTDFERLERQIDSQSDEAFEPLPPDDAGVQEERESTQTLLQTQETVPPTEEQQTAVRQQDPSIADPLWSNVAVPETQLTGAVRRPASSTSSVHSPVESEPSHQLSQELEQSATSVSDLNGPGNDAPASEEAQTELAQTQESDESVAFQTQDPGTTRSQSQKQHAADAPVPPPQLAEAAALAELRASTASARNTALSRRTATPRPSTYDVPTSENRPSSGPRSQHRTTLHSNQSSNVERSEPGRLPNRLGATTRLALSRTHNQAQLARNSTTQSPLQSQPLQRSQSQSQPTPTVELPRDPREPWGPPDASGKVQVGRLGFEATFHVDSLKRHQDKELWAAASKLADKPENRHIEFELQKLNTFRYIAMCGQDWEEHHRLVSKEKRIEREQKAKKQMEKAEREEIPQLEQASRKLIGANGEMADQGIEEMDREDDDSDEDGEDDRSFPEDDDDDIPGAPIVPAEFPDGVDHDRQFEEVEDEEEVAPNVAHFHAINGLPNGHVSDVDDDDAELPTAPPLEPVEEGTAPTDRELQTLVQSEDVDVYDDAKSFVGTRPISAHSKSPSITLERLPPKAHEARESEDESVDGIDERGLDQGPARRPNGRFAKSEHSKSKKNTRPEADESLESEDQGLSLDGTNERWVPNGPFTVSKRSKSKKKKLPMVDPVADDNAGEAMHRSSAEDEGVRSKKRKRQTMDEDVDEASPDEGEVPKKKSNKKKPKTEATDDIAMTDGVYLQAQQEAQDDRTAMPPPPKTSTREFMPPEDWEKRKRQRATKRQRRRTRVVAVQNRLESASASLRSASYGSSTLSNIAVTPNVNPQTVEGETPAANPQQVVTSIEPGTTSTKKKTKGNSERRRQLNRKVTPIGETQSTDTTTDTQKPTQQRGGIISTLGNWVGSFRPSFPPAPASRPVQPVGPPKLPFGSDDESSSKESCDGEEGE